MRKNIFLLFCLPIACLAQNLVPNPSFETFSSCPVAYAQMSLAFPWTDPTNASSDFFNSCSSGPYISTPNNFTGSGANGFQLPRSGNGYAGFYAYATFSREYIQVLLIDSLAAGVVYRVEFYVSFVNFDKYAVDAIGAYFSLNSISGPSGNVLNYSPQVSNSVGNFLADTLNWMQITGTFTATGGEKYLTIGNFKPDSLTNRIVVNNSALDTVSSYYYIDDVQVYPDSVTSAIEFQKNKSISVYPNPAKDQLFISVSDENIKTVFVEITDITGKLIYSSEISIDNFVGRLNFNIENGIYLGRITDNNSKKQSVQKIVINK
jgi:hypothetical protein